MKWTRQKDWTCKSWDGLLARYSGYKDCELWEEPFAGLAVSISACSMCETSYACLSRVLISSSDPVRDRRQMYHIFIPWFWSHDCLLADGFLTKLLPNIRHWRAGLHRIWNWNSILAVIGLDEPRIRRIRWLLAELLCCLLGYSQWEFHFKLIRCHMIKDDDGL